MMNFKSMVSVFSLRLYRFSDFMLIPALFFVFVMSSSFNSFIANAQAQPEETPPMPGSVSEIELDETALKENIAARVRTTRGAQDEGFKKFTADLVIVEKKVPVHINEMTFFAVKIKMFSPPPGAGEDIISLVVDKSGSLQIADIHDLASGNSLTQDAMNQLVSSKDIPPDFGKEIFRGTGSHAVIVISDPFCPYCRKGWNYIKLQREKIKTLRLSHFPLNRPAEVACMVMADANKNQFKLFEVVDFAYSQLNPVPVAEDIITQFMDAFPELKAKWGEDPANALKYLEENYLHLVREERKSVQALGINSTPVFFVNDEFIKGFNAEKLDKAMP